MGESLGAGEVCVNPPSPKNELLEPPGGTVEVGEGRTSVKRDGGSFLSVFQMPVPHGNEPPAEWTRPRTPAEAGWEPQAASPGSPEGVLGWEVVGEMVLLAKDPFLWRGTA